MSELPPQPQPEAKKIILPHEFTDEEKRRFGGTSYHSYEDYDERAGAQAEREYAAGDKGPEPAPDGTPESQPALDEDEARSEVDKAFNDVEPDSSEAETTKMDAVDEDDSEETTEMPKVEKGDEETTEERRERIMREIDEADAMKRPTKRMKALERIAYTTAQRSDDMDLATEATKRLRHSKTRKKFNPYGLWVRNTQAHDNIMHKLSQKPSKDKDRLDIAGNIQRGHKRNAVIGAIIESAYTSSHEISNQAEEKFKESDDKFKESNPEDRNDEKLVESALLEDEARSKEKEAERLKKKGDRMVSERLHGWRSSKHRGEVLEHWAALRNDPEVLLSLRSLDHFFRRGRIKRRLKEVRQREESKIFS